MTDVVNPLGSHVRYAELNGKQQEIYNFQKVAALLADYGYNCIKLSDDWKGADFLADHFSSNVTLRVQLKSCLTVSKSYEGKGIHITFPINGEWFLVDHDELMRIVMKHTNVANTKSWINKGLYWNHTPNSDVRAAIEHYRLAVPSAARQPAAAKSPTKGAAGPMSCFVRVGREVVGPMTQTRAAVTTITEALRLELTSVEVLKGIVGSSVVRSVEGSVRDDALWRVLVAQHGLNPEKKSRWAVDQPIYRDGRTWVVQTNVWSKARMVRLQKIAEITDGAIEIDLGGLPKQAVAES